MATALRTRGEPGSIAVHNLGETFRLYHSRPRGLRDRLMRFERAVYEDFWALRGVTFGLARGESLALIGPNGSGKSTLLKCLTGILPPDEGTIEVNGKVASLLELGAGFHGDLTGMENIYLNGSILGLNRREIDSAVADIVKFSGVEEFIHSPVRTYSSGMYVRLGFAIAINVAPDILLIDEILAVGDAAFQTKCFERMHEFKRRGTTIVLVSHDLDAVARLCDRAILLNKGEVVADGDARSVVDLYRRRVLAEQIDEGGRRGFGDRNSWGTGEARIRSVELVDEHGRAVENVHPHQTCTFRMTVEFGADVQGPIFGMILRAGDGTRMFDTNTMWRGMETNAFHAGDVVEVRFRQTMNLLPGEYVYTATVAHRDATQWYEWWEDCLTFHLRGMSVDQGYANLAGEIDFSLVETGSVSELS